MLVILSYVAPTDPTVCRPHFFTLKVSWKSMDGTSISLVTASKETKFSMLHSITLLLFDHLGVPPDGDGSEMPSALHSPPNDSTDGEVSTNCNHR